MRFLALLCLLLFACDDGANLAPAPVADAGKPATPPRPIDEPATPDDPDSAAAPTLAKIDPASGALGSVGPVIIATGTGFVPRSVLQVDGTDLDTSFDSATQISATIPTAKLAKVGELKVLVRTPKPGGGESPALPFAVENPPPEIIALSPLSIPSGSGDTKLIVVGTTLVSGAKIKFGTTELATTFKDSEHLEGTITAALLTKSSSVPVTVTTPAPGGGTSTKIAFTISNAAAKITSLTPPMALIGGPDFELVVKGTGFATGAAILFNGTKLMTTTGAAGELKATVTTDLVNLFEIPVNVEIPPPGGGVSEPFVFKAENPVPTAASVAPLTIPAGSNGTAVTLTGTNFVSATKMTVDGAVIAATTVLGPTQIKATLTAAQLAKVGSAQIGAKTDPPGGGPSPTTAALGVTLAVPKVTTIDGSTITINANDATITIKGMFFVAATTATAGGQPIMVTYAKGDTITAVVPSTMLTKLGPIPIVVTNTGAGGGSAAAVNVNVVCDTNGVNAILKNTTDVQSFSTLFATAPLLSRWTSDGTCPNVTFSAVVQKQPGRYSIVQNATAAPVTLSAWADCTGDNKGAAYLALYRRPTPPAEGAERGMCEGFVADGTPHASPSSGTSTTCPGLTKANGGGITLAACERAIVHIQPFDNASTTFTPPPTLKIQAE